MCPHISKSAEEGIAAVEVRQLPRVALDKNQIRIAVKSASLNFPELLMMQKKYQYQPKLPFVLCSEGAGVVTEAGSLVSEFKVGDRVFFSLGTNGAASEEIVLTAARGGVFHLPDPLSFSQGAGFLMGYTTGYHALVHRGRLQPGEWLLVTGAAGGMGLAAVQLGKALGAKVIAAASSDEKLEVCKKVGADAVVNYKTEKLKEAVDRITNGEFCDVIYDPVGGDVFDQCVRCVAPKGLARLLVIGFADGRIPSLPANMALIKGFDLVGVRMGAQMSIQPDLMADMIKELLKLAGEGRLAPYVGSEFPMERAKEAFTLMHERKVLGKTCITFNAEKGASKL
jgi:NADPH2:quinone reductase